MKYLILIILILSIGLVGNAQAIESPVIFKVNNLESGIIDLRVNMPPDVYIMNKHVHALLETESNGCKMIAKCRNILVECLPLVAHEIEKKYYTNSIRQIEADLKSYCK